jgi:hypothetical protein
MAMLGGECSSCCEGLCLPLRDRATITLSGLPTSCTAGSLFNRELGDDNCSYPLFRIRSGNNQNVCKYATVWHSRDNRWINFAAYGANRIVLDVANESLLLVAETVYVVFTPPPGKSFRDFPFDDVLVCASAYSGNPATCPQDAFSNVRVVIDDSTAAYVPFICPQDASGNIVGNSETCSCVPGIDTRKVNQLAESGLVRTAQQIVPIYSCAPCDGNNYSIQTTTTTYKPPPCSSDEKSNCIESVTTASSRPDLNVNVSFGDHGVDFINSNFGWQPYSYSLLSGSYALKWTNSAYIGNGNFFGLSFPDWQLTDIDSSGAGNPSYGSGTLGWQNENQPAEQGWKIDYRKQHPSNWNTLGMILVVAPVKTTTVIDKAGKSIVSTPCGFGQIAYQIKLAVFRRPVAFGVDSDYVYWNWDFSCYANVSCRNRVCGDVPSVSLNSTEKVFVPLSGVWYSPRGKLGQVSVSISS